MKYIIQTRRKDLRPRPKFDLSDIPDGGGGNQDLWKNLPFIYEDFEDAKKESETLIKHMQHEARDVRILKVVCGFDSEIIVKAREPYEG